MNYEAFYNGMSKRAAQVRELPSAAETLNTLNAQDEAASRRMQLQQKAYDESNIFNRMLHQRPGLTTPTDPRMLEAHEAAHAGREAYKAQLKAQAMHDAQPWVRRLTRTRPGEQPWHEFANDVAKDMETRATPLLQAAYGLGSRPFGKAVTQIKKVLGR